MPVAHTTAPTLTDLLFEDGAVGRCLVAPDGTVIRANAEWLRSTGLTAEHAVGENIIDLFPATRDMALALHARVRAGHRVEVPRHAQPVNGRETWWEGSIEPVAMEGGTGLLITARAVRTEFQELYETAPAAFLVLAPDRPRFTIVAASDAYLRATKTTRDIIGRGIFEVFPDDPGDPESTGSPARASFERVLASGTADAMAVQKHSLRRSAAEGGGFEERYWSPLNTPVLGEGGAVRYIHHRVEDVTEFVRAKQAGAELQVVADALRTRAGEMEADVLRRARELQDVNQRLRAANERLAALDREREREAEAKVREGTALLQAISDTSGDVIYAKDREGRLRFANPATLALIGKPLGSVIGRTDAEILADAEAARLVMENDRRIMSSGVAEELEERVPMPDGSERVWLSRKTPFRDAAGAVAGLLGISRDITDRKRIESALRDANTRLQLTIDGITDGVLVMDREWRYTFVSARAGEIIGLSPDQLVGGRVWDLFPSARGTKFYDGYHQAVATGQPVHFEEYYPAPLDQWLECHCYPTADGLTVYFRDVTDRKRWEQELRDADRRKDEFLAMLAHELRNPLAPIRNSSCILRHATAGTEQARRAQAVIERQTQHLTRLVDDLLDVTRIVRGKIELLRERVDLREVVGRAADDFRFRMDQNGVAFRVTVPDVPLWAEADPTRVTQVVGNLLHNAAKFTRRGDEVVVSVAGADGCAEVRVRDTGHGIDAALLPRVFDPFVQADQSLARTQGGLGLGLALVKGIVELHGGSVRAASGGLGAGAEFILRFPLAGVVPDADRAPRDERREANGGRRVLVVDDNRDAAESLADIVRMLGHTAEVAFDGPSALEHARAHPFDVVLCDIGLPGMSGYDVARALRANGRAVQLIAVSGYAQPEDVKKAVEAGFDGHVAKPPDLGELERLLA